MLIRDLINMFAYGIKPLGILGLSAAATGGLFSLGGTLLGGLMGGGGGGSTQQQAQAASPFTGQYQQYQPMLANLVNNPSSVTSTPGYQFNLGQGEAAVNQGMAGMGLLGSGNQAAGLAKYGQDYATNQYQTQLQNLSSLSGVNYGSGAAAAGIMSGANQAGGVLGGQIGTGIGNLLSGWTGGTTSSDFGAANPYTFTPNTTSLSYTGATSGGVAPSFNYGTP